MPEQEIMPMPESPVEEEVEQVMQKPDDFISKEELQQNVPPPEPPTDEEVFQTNYITKEPKKPSVKKKKKQ